MTPLGLYLHWPYCARICPYCDFTVARNRAVDEGAWTAALTEDLKRFADMTERRPLASVYFGGGTPSLIPPRIAEAVLGEAERLFGFGEGCELTIEANPDDRLSFRSLSALGFGRLSLGVQSLDDAELAFLGRNHDAQEGRLAISEALAVFGEVSLDFIYALPGQDLAAWRRRLVEIVGLGAAHLSLYQLTIEPDTAFGRAAGRGALVPMPDDRAADFYEATDDAAAAAGFPAYEVSNHARPGHEAVHNALYWQSAEWIGLGPGAHGRLGSGSRRIATEGDRRIADYPHKAFAERQQVLPLSLLEHRLEVLAGGLRPVAGLDLARLGSDAGAVRLAARPLIEDGLMRLEAGRLGATPRGRLVLDQLASLLASSVSGEDEPSV